jgi:hypothetical protein
MGLIGNRVTGEWRKLYDKELYNLYSSSNTIQVIKSRRMRWEGHVAYTGDRRGAHQVMVGKPEGERPLGRPKNREKDNINMYLQDVREGNMNWLPLEDRDRWWALVNVAMNFWVP